MTYTVATEVEALSSTRQRALYLAAVSLVVYLLLLLATIVQGESLLGGPFVYALDDPYIHLALADNLAHGHYGINAGEVSSPSSSVLWPFLLIPFAGTAFHPFLPLVLNVVFGLAAAALLGWIVGQWAPLRGMAGWQLALTAGLLVLCANLAGLALLGMEHSLEVLVAIICAYGLGEALRGKAVPFPCLLAAVLGPAVRYECLGLTMALCLALAGQRRLRTALLVAAFSVLPLLAMAGFLLSHGLPPLPLSVLVKAQLRTADAQLLTPAQALLSTIVHTFTSAERLPILVLTLTLAGMAAGETVRARRFALAGAAAVGALHLAVGRFGWLHRYEVYALIFLLLVVLQVLHESGGMPFGWLALGLALTASPYLTGLMQTPAAMADIYDQQYQMHRFVTEFYSGNYAVNDLGWASYQKRPGAYVLDLWGLGSAEAARHPEKSAAWLSNVVARKQTPLAMLFPKWFHIPPAWTPLAEMCITRAVTVLVPEKCVVFYSTQSDEDAPLREDLERFAPTLPKDVTLQFGAVKEGARVWLPVGRRP